MTHITILYFFYNALPDAEKQLLYAEEMGRSEINLRKEGGG
jgi:hypothetical protein